MSIDDKFDSAAITFSNDPIGFLVPGVNGGLKVVCIDCEATYRAGRAAPLTCKLYRINVHPYKQSCHICGYIMYREPGSNVFGGMSELFPVENAPSEANPDADGFFKWTVEISVAQLWVADGFDLTNRRAHDIMTSHLGYAEGSEIKTRVLEKPSDEAVAKAQGYPDVESFRKASHKWRV